MGKTTTTKVPYQTVKYPLKEWGLVLFLVKLPNMTDPKDAWFSVRPLCVQMGLDPPTQRDRIRAEPRFDGYWHELPVETDAGERESLCLRIEKIGLWFTIINSLKMNERYRGKLQALQKVIEYKAAVAVLGEEATRHLLTPPWSEEEEGEPVTLDAHTRCPNCAVPLNVVSDGKGPLRIVRGKEV